MASADVENCCIVAGLGPETDESSLKTAFSKYGEVIDAKITSDSDTGFPKGLVTFKDEKSMKDAINGMDGQQLDAYTITVKEAGAVMVTRVSTTPLTVQDTKAMDPGLMELITE